MPHGHRIYAKSYNMAKAKICAYSQSDHVLPHLKFPLQCCAKFSSINLPDQERDDNYPNPSPSIRFHIYNIIACCTKHARLPLTDKKSCRKYQQYTALGQSTKMYTRKQLVMMETTISDLRTSFYISEIQKLAFHIPRVQTLGTNNCGDSR